MAEKTIKNQTKFKAKYTKKQVTFAGEQFLNDNIFKNEKVFNDSMEILSYWRSSHEVSLNNALELLKNISLIEDKNAIFAKRMKRFVSIFDKKRRFPKMDLKNMQDIGGCRAIVSSPKKLSKIVRKLRKRPEFKNKEGKIIYKDYILNPKEDGYRSYHLIGNFKNGINEERKIEVQLRTRLQHDWATTLEIVDLFTGQALKSNQGKSDWADFFSNVSKQFAVMEEIKLFETLDIKKKFNAYSKAIINIDSKKKESCAFTKIAAKKLEVEKHLRAYSNTLDIVDRHISENTVEGYALIRVDTFESTVNTKLFNKAENEKAEREYIQLEKEATNNKNIVVALVSTTAIGGIKEAYPNYFADSKDFILHLKFITDVQLDNSKSFLSKIFS